MSSEQSPEYFRGVADLSDRVKNARRIYAEFLELMQKSEVSGLQFSIAAAKEENGDPTATLTTPLGDVQLSLGFTFMDEQVIGAVLIWSESQLDSPKERTKYGTVLLHPHDGWLDLKGNELPSDTYGNYGTKTARSIKGQIVTALIRHHAETTATYQR
ncbi:hypothetical protein [uncultured Xylophilus sp.]|uniref:hypothetical protein n=1 Tax=uncultured Xylophilus sp. TaxID=296832 RepID=UPI0025D9EB5C|nr:hypothetical protein [uncultured Xylophilus sp.]